MEQSTTESQETSTDNPGMTTDSATEDNTQAATTNQPHSSNGNNSCPPLEQGQNYFVCPTGFRRHPQDCSMFYQCSQSPETSHYSIVTFQCPNDTIYDEGEIMCRDRTAQDNCQSNTSDSTRLLMDLENNNSSAVSIRLKIIKFVDLKKFLKQFKIRTKRSLCPEEGHFPLEEDDICAPTFLKCGMVKEKMEGHVYRCPTGYVYWQKSRRCEKSAKIPDCMHRYTRQRLGVPVEWNNLGYGRNLLL